MEYVVKKRKKPGGAKDFFTFFFPNFAIVLLLLFCAIEGLALEYDAIPILNAGEEFLSGEEWVLFIVISVIVPIFIPIELLFCVGMAIGIAVTAPIEFFTNGFVLDNFIFWLFDIGLILLFFGAARLRPGKWAEDHSYVSGSHYEITFDSDGKGTAKEVTDYAGDTGFFKNICLYVLRY